MIGDRDLAPAWPSCRVTDLLGIDHPIFLSPMAQIGTADLALAVCEAGGLGSIGCASLSPEDAAHAIATLHALTDKPFGVNFFCHHQAAPDPDREAAWQDALRPYYRERNLPFGAPATGRTITPFDDAMCGVVERAPPAVVSFHFGLPAPQMVARLKAVGCLVMSTATTVEEAIWLEARGVDIVIAQGIEAGGHRGMFLPTHPATALAGQMGTVALVPQVADAVRIPVVAAGGIADGRGIAAAFALGADAVQIGTGYLRCPEVAISALYRRALDAAGGGDTVVTNVFTGRPARAIGNRLVRDLGPISNTVPAFPVAMGATRQLAADAAQEGCTDFTAFWAGEAVAMGRALPAKTLTAVLVAEAMSQFSGRPKA